MFILIYKNKEGIILCTEEIPDNWDINKFLEENEKKYPQIEILEKKKTLFYIENKKKYKHYLHQNNEIIPE